MIIDDFFLQLMHTLAVNFGMYLTPFFKFITFIGDKGWFFLLVSFILCLKKNTRWIGITSILAIFLSWIVGSHIIKEIVARNRPYLSENILYNEYWRFIKSTEDLEYSFPSGHTSAITAFFTSLIICESKNKKKIILRFAIFSIIIMICSRMYLMHHYFTDCIAGLILGIIMSYIARYIVKKIYDFINEKENIPFFRFILNFDLFRK